MYIIPVLRGSSDEACVIRDVKRGVMVDSRISLHSIRATRYNKSKDISRDLPWIDALINTHMASAKDIREANSWRIKLDKLLIQTVGIFLFIIPLLAKPISTSVHETKIF